MLERALGNRARTNQSDFMPDSTVKSVDCSVNIPPHNACTLAKMEND